MNVADSRRVASALENLGYLPSSDPETADVIVLNTCVVRQSAEDKAYGRLASLRPLKERKPGVVINLMGCLVGVRGNQGLRDRFPFVDVFSPPSDPRPLVVHLLEREGRILSKQEVDTLYAEIDGDLPLPSEARGRLVSAHVPIVYGCSHACTFCIIPSRRGAERSRSADEVVNEVRRLSDQGVREVTLLGQIVDRYGKDLQNGETLCTLLRRLQEIDSIRRIRFLTSHPNWMTDELIETVAELPKVAEHFEVPVQAGDDEVLSRMRRRYTSADYRGLIERIRRRVPDASIATDVIVGFPGETDQQFERTYALLAELRLDVVHLARYSPRPGTVAARRFEDDVPESEKLRRFRALENLQKGIAQEINSAYLGNAAEVLVEGKHKGRWKGRTRTNKLVFFEASGELSGELATVTIDWTGPWSMIGVQAISTLRPTVLEPSQTLRQPDLTPGTQDQLDTFSLA